MFVKATKEEREVDEHIKKYENKLQDLMKKLRIIDLKKKRVLTALDANRSRHAFATQDAQQSTSIVNVICDTMSNMVLASYRLDEIRERVCALGAALDKTQDKNKVRSTGCTSECS